MRKFASLIEGPSKAVFADIRSEKPVVDLKESPGRITVSYTFPGFYFIDDDRDVDDKKVEFKQIEIASLGYLMESGKPMLPSFGRYVQIPPGTDYDISVEKGRPVTFDDVIVSPAQSKLKDVIGEHAFEFDRSFYSESEFYPEEILNVSGPFDMDRYHVLLLNVTPFQYSPDLKKLIGYGKVTVTIDLSQKKAEVRMPPGRTVNKAAFGNLLLNPGSKIERRLGMSEAAYATQPSAEPGSAGSLIRHGPELLIIYYDGSLGDASFEEAAGKLAGWKNRRGIVTITEPISSIGNDVSRIKSFIRDQKGRNPDLGYVLLFGDSDMIKAELIDHGGSENNVTDYYYSTQTDPKGPKDYLLPWLSIGRIPVRTAEQGMNAVDKIISYERDPVSDPGYYRRMTFAAEFEDMDEDGREDNKADYIKTMEEIRSALLPLGYEISRVYVTAFDGGRMLLYNNRRPVPADVSAAVVDNDTAKKMLIKATTEGQLIMGHRDHGEFDGWLHPKFGVSDLEEITGTAKTIFYSINCWTGKFDVNPVPCFAEKNLIIPCGAPSLIAASRDSDTLLNNELVKGLFDATFAGVLPTFAGTANLPMARTRIGDISNYAKSYIPLTASKSDEDIKDHLEIYHVIGDPTLEVWTAPPRDVKVNARLAQDVLDVQISECPQGSILTIWLGEEMMQRIEPPSVHITIPLDTLLGSDPHGDERKEISVCFHAPGYRYAEVIAG